MGPTAHHMLDVDVAEHGSTLPYRLCSDVVDALTALQLLDDRLSAIEQVESDGIAQDVGHGDIANVDVFHHTAATPATLETQTGIGAQELAVIDPYIAHTAAHLAAHDETAMTIEHRATVHHHILGGTSTAAPLLISSALEADAVVAGIERGVNHQHIAARLHIDGITILRIGRVAHHHLVHYQVLTQQRMQAPVGRVLEGHPLEQHIAATLQIEQHRAHFHPLL